jgi:hypothetical protein
MGKFIIQPHGRLNDWVADEKGYFTEEGLDYELNVEGSRKNTPRLAAVDSAVALEDNRFGAFERYASKPGFFQRWLGYRAAARKLFDLAPDAGVSYEQAVDS